MSRIGRKPIVIPQGVQIEVAANTVKVTGPKGVLTQTVHPEIKVIQENDMLRVERPSDDKLHRSLHGLTR
ncbi:MAG: 50S ribosomal protein L6, partial [Bacillota bacterium]